MRRAWVVGIVLVGCAEEPRSGGPREPVSSSPVEPTTPTSSEPTEEPPLSTYPQPECDLTADLPPAGSPSVVLQGEGEISAHDTRQLPAFGQDPGVLLLQRHEDDYGTVADLPERVLVPGCLPTGTWRLREVWDGVSSQTGFFTLASAGDVDGDGHLDAWWDVRLLLGPFLGRELSYATAARAEFPSVMYGTTFWMDHAGLDLDQDGAGDAVVSRIAGGDSRVGVYYGPFSGVLPDDEPETLLEGTSSVHVVADAGGPGQPRAMLSDGGYGGYYPETWVVDLPTGRPPTAPRVGTALVPAGAFSTGLEGTGDLDGDGTSEVLATATYGGGIYSWSVLQGPIEGDLDPSGPSLFAEVSGELLGAIGDLDGDGREELLGMATGCGGYQRPTISFSPHPATIDWCAGVPVPMGEHLYGGPRFFLRPLHDPIDHDGDGIPDLVGWAGNELLLWYGRHLLQLAGAR